MPHSYFSPSADIVCVLLLVSAIIIAGKAVLRCSLTIILLFSLSLWTTAVVRVRMMSDTLRKRGRESVAQPDSTDVREPKRFHGEETDRFLHLLQLEQTLAEDEQEEECIPSEEIVNGVMKSLEQEISATCSTSYRSSNSGDNSATSDISSNCEGQTLNENSGIDLCYLLEASDDELGILPSPVLDLKEAVCLSPKDSFEGLWDSSDLKSLAENWHFEDEFEYYQQFALCENAWNGCELQDYMNKDIVSQGMLFDGVFSEPWTL